MAKTHFHVERKELVLAVRSPVGRRSLEFVGAAVPLGGLSPPGVFGAHLKQRDSPRPGCGAGGTLTPEEPAGLVSRGIESFPPGGLAAEEAGFFLPWDLVELQVQGRVTTSGPA